MQFTRSRPYKKNDSVVRHLVGYHRFEGEELPEEVKDELRRRKSGLDLETLLVKVDELQAKLISMAVPWTK